MPTRKTIFWILAAGILYLIAWNIGGGWLYAIIAILVAFPAGSLLLSRYNTGSLHIDILGPDTGVQGDELAVRLVVTNRSRIPRFLLRIDCSHAGSSASVLILRLEGRERKTVPVRFAGARRGIYHDCAVEVTSRAPVGLARSRRRVRPACPAVIYPRWQPLSADWGAGGHSTGYSATTLLTVRSPSSDYLGVREYRPGDSPRSIHWKTSARSNRLAVIEYSRQATLTPVFIVDTYDEAAADGDGEPFETAVSVAASLVQREAALNHLFGCATALDDEALQSLGRSPEAAMLMLAGLEADARAPLTERDVIAGGSEVTPVLILTSHVRYAAIARSELIELHPGTLVLMLDGRNIAASGRVRGRMMDDRQLALVAEELAAAGCSFTLLASREDMARCLESL